jgi:restriction system protein
MGGSGTIQEINDKTIDVGKFSEEQQNVLHGKGPKTEIEYRLAWARTYLKSVGALTNSGRGVWSLTEKGRGMTEAEVCSGDS